MTVFEVICLRNVCNIRRTDKVRNSLIREVWVRVAYTVKSGEECVEVVRPYEKDGGREILIEREHRAIIDGNGGRKGPQRR